MSFMDLIRRPSRERKLKEKGMMTGSPDPVPLRKKLKSIYAEAYEKEKEKLRDERTEAKQKRKEYKIKRAGERARRDARNPLYRRIAKRMGAASIKAIDIGASQVGKEMGKLAAQHHQVQKEKQKAGREEFLKLTRKREKEAVRAKFKKQHPKRDLPGAGDLPDIGLSGFDPLGLKKSSKKSGMNILGSGGNYFGSNKKKKKKSDGFEGLL